MIGFQDRDQKNLARVCAAFEMQYAAMRRRKVYLIGSLRNPEIARLGRRLREALPQAEVFSRQIIATISESQRTKVL